MTLKRFLHLFEGPGNSGIYHHYILQTQGNTLQTAEDVVFDS